MCGRPLRNCGGRGLLFQPDVCGAVHVRCGVLLPYCLDEFHWAHLPGDVFLRWRLCTAAPVHHSRVLVSVRFCSLCGATVRRTALRHQHRRAYIRVVCVRWHMQRGGWVLLPRGIKFLVRCRLPSSILLRWWRRSYRAVRRVRRVLLPCGVYVLRRRHHLPRWQGLLRRHDGYGALYLCARAGLDKDGSSVLRRLRLFRDALQAGFVLCRRRRAAGAVHLLPGFCEFVSRVKLVFRQRLHVRCLRSGRLVCGRSGAAGRVYLRRGARIGSARSNRVHRWFGGVCRVCWRIWMRRGGGAAGAMHVRCRILRPCGEQLKLLRDCSRVRGVWRRGRVWRWCENTNPVHVRPWVCLDSDHGKRVRGKHWRVPCVRGWLELRGKRRPAR